MFLSYVPYTKEKDILFSSYIHDLFINTYFLFKKCNVLGVGTKMFMK